MSKLKEVDILNGIKNGEPEILETFYKENLPKIIKLILKNSGDKEDAEDVFQDALVFVYQKLNENKLHLTCTLSTYTYAVCRNIWMNKLRRKSKMISSEDYLKDISCDSISIFEEFEKKEKQFLFQKHFLRLGESCQKILLLFFNGKSMLEISKIMNYSPGYTRKKKFECTKKLSDKIETDKNYKELFSSNK